MVYPYRVAKFACVLSSEKRQWRKTQNFRRVGENSGHILAVSGLKFMKFWDDVKNPLQLSTPIPDDCLCHDRRRRYWPSKLRLRCEVVENTSAVFRPQIFVGNFYGSLLPWFTPTVWQSLVEFCGLKCVCETRQWKKAAFSEGGWKLRSYI